MLDSVWIFNGICGGQVSAERVTQQNHLVDPHHSSPSLNWLDILILHFRRLFRELWSWTLTESQQIDGVDRAILRERIKVEDPKANASTETVQQDDGSIVTKRVDGECPNFVIHSDTVADIDIKLMMSWSDTWEENKFRSHETNCRVELRESPLTQRFIIGKEEEEFCKTLASSTTTLPESIRSSCLSSASVECPHLSIDDRKRLIGEYINILLKFKVESEWDYAEIFSLFP